MEEIYTIGDVLGATCEFVALPVTASCLWLAARAVRQKQVIWPASLAAMFVNCLLALGIGFTLYWILIIDV